jgi:hypothetical protein
MDNKVTVTTADLQDFVQWILELLGGEDHYRRAARSPVPWCGWMAVLPSTPRRRGDLAATSVRCPSAVAASV